MQRAVMQLDATPGEVLVDGLHCPRIVFPVRAVVRGDATVPEISAASIVAKVARDAIMMQMHAEFPCYGFDRHKGYPTAAHIAALRQFGPSPIHRSSFGPVRQLLNGD